MKNSAPSSRPRRSLTPWLLLTASLALNAWLLLGPRAAPVAPGIADPALRPAAAPAVLTSAPLTLPAAPSPTRAAEEAIATSRERGHLTPAGAAEARTYAAYADLLARELVTANQQADLQRVLARWVATDPVGASAWLEAQPPSPGLDHALVQLATFLTSTGRYEHAAEWAASVGDPTLRVAAFEEIFAEGYRHRAFDAAAVRRSGLPADRITAILDGSRLD